MNIILLSGGSGKRLWPLSSETRSKQFLKLFRRPDGTKESMLQRMYRMIRETDSEATVTIATSENQVTKIREQLGEQVNISVEPDRRDTFPAIALAAAYLKTQNTKDEDPVIVCPVDPFVEADYFECLQEAEKAAAGANLTLIGIEPSYPSEKYGYIIPETNARISLVSGFREKPDEGTAKEYIRRGALWNAGVFIFRLSYLLSIAEKELGTSDYHELYAKYTTLPKISFDYAVVEKEPSIQVIRFAGSWQDLGTWNTLTEAMDEEATGNTTMSGCTNTHIINELDIPLIALGMKDCVIAVTPDGILISDKAMSPELKNLIKEPQITEKKKGPTR